MKTYYKHCLDLAKSFIEDSNVPSEDQDYVAELLAIKIQETIENLLSDYLE